MKQNLYAIGVFSALSLIGSVATAQTIVGKVSGENHFLNGANVQINGVQQNYSTDKEGSFTAKLAPGVYSLSVTYVGYAPSKQKVTLAKDQVLNLDIQLSPLANMQEVVVVSSRKPSKISDIPGAVWVIDGTKLQEQARAGVPLKEALGKLIPGLDAGPEGRTNYGQNLRGRDVLVMIDGVSLNSTRVVSRQFESIDPFNIERVEVLSGASSVYGGGATGGIINIVSKKGKYNSLPQFTTQAGVRSGLRQNNDHDVRVAQSIAGGGEDWNGRIGFAYQKNNAAYGADNKQIFTDITQTDLQYNQSFDLFGSTEFKLSEKQKLSLNAQYFSSGYTGDRDLFLGTNYSGLLANGALLEMRNGFKSSVTPKTQRANVNATYQVDDILGGQTLYLQGMLRYEKFAFHPFPAQLIYATGLPAPANFARLIYSASSTQQTNYGAGKLVLTKDWAKVNLTYGLDADHETFNAKQDLFNMPTAYASGGLINNSIAQTERYPDFRVNGLSPFAQLQFKLADFLTLSGGIRHQFMYVKVDDFVGAPNAAGVAYGIGRSAATIPGGKSNYDVNLLNGGLVFKINEPQQVWFNYSQGFNLADPAKYYGQGAYNLVGGTTGSWALSNSVNVAGSPLTGIKTNQYEVGYRYRTSQFNAQIAPFYSLSDKNARTNSTYNVEVYDENVRNFGAEASVSFTAKSGFEAGANGMYIKTQKENANGSWALQDVNATSPSKISGYLGYGNKFFGLRAQIFHSFDLKGNHSMAITANTPPNALADFTTVDLLGHVKVFSGQLSLGVQNLLNKKYQTIWSQRSQILYSSLATKETFYYAGRGRTFNVTYTINY